MNPMKHLFYSIDRLLTLCFFAPLTRIRPHTAELRIPILMYHSISDEREKVVHPYFQTVTTPQVFAQHMKFLYENKYKVINISQAVEYLFSANSKENKFVVLTFDDGYRDFYTKVFPMLDKYGFCASVFLPTSYISNNRKTFKGKECLTWLEVRELHTNGVIFGSHTVSHPNLHELKKRDMELELKLSKEKIGDQIGESIECFSYPFAFPENDKKFVRELKGMLQKSGYRYGVTTRIGTTMRKDDKHFLKRIIINNFDNSFFFKTKLNGGYDWLYKLQFFVKSIKQSKVLR